MSTGSYGKLTSSCTVQRRVEFLESKIQGAIGESKRMTGVASWEWVQCWTMDVGRFKTEKPKLYERYKRDSGSRRFALERVDLTATD